MASDDDFESSSGSTSSSDAEYKYAQLVVPAFKFDAASTDVDTDDSDVCKVDNGSSFVRLGSFPEYTTSTGQDGVTSTTAADDAPSGFIASLKLAKLVGDADAIASSEGEDGAPGGSGIVRDADTFKGDSNYLLGFTDDTRYRDPDEKTFIRGEEVDNTTANRKAETRSLLTKGGWWDHSDGNRVSTTSGDKIEVIQGNYKMVILGRQDPEDFAVGKTAITDFSGGHFQEQYTSPTPAIKTIQWVKEDDGWTLFQDNGSGNVTTRFHGKQVDYYTGSRKESIVGEDPGSPDGKVSKADGSNDPELISRTWAQKIESYTGSVNKPVPHVFSLTFADAKEDITFAASVVSTTTAASIVSVTAGASIIATNTAGVDLISVNAAPLMLTVNAVGMAADFKSGTYYSYGTSTTHIRGNGTTLEAGAEVLSLKQSDIVAMKSELNNYAATLALEAVNVGIRLNGLHNEVWSVVSSLNVTLAAQHLFL